MPLDNLAQLPMLIRGAGDFATGIAISEKARASGAAMLALVIGRPAE
jgi:hypothetical protein